MMYYGTYGMGMWGMLLMLVGSVLLWGLVVGGVVLLAHYLRNPGPPVRTAGEDPTARHLLAQRFARGEIDENEYHRRLSVLDATPPRPPGR
ncbi:SHOCT domain-containing protein [Promicromonospora sp. NPDC050262]|uniref:SHOCT domain-containing protein n=1 Tax=Promicromonospora sp. NPDC050262 TaxID=3155036 RepID=UPI00340FC7B3